MLPSLPLACQTSALLMSYVPKMERVNGVAPSSQPWHGRILLLNHTRTNWCPQPDSHRQPDASDAPALCFELWGRKEETPGRSLPPAHIPRTGPLDLLRVQGLEKGRRSGPAVLNARASAPGAGGRVP